MSDFLSNLAARATAQTPAVRPLVRSVYEPPASGEITQPAAPVAAVVRGVETPPMVPIALPAPVRFADETGRGQNARPTGGEGMLPAASSSPPAHPPALQPAVAFVPVPVRIAEGIAHRQHARTTGGAGMMPAAAASSPPLPPALQPAPADVPAPIRIADGIGHGQHARTTGGASMLPAAAPLPPLERHLPVVPVLLPKIPPAPRPQVLPAAAPALSNQPSARAVAAQIPPPAPTVTITIGRVEIRAAAPAAQPSVPASSAAGPPLSLETYLRRSASRSA
jgi:Meckel syndrome type 1 protein